MNKPRSAPRRRVDGVLLLDKPSGMTSNAALMAVKRLFNAAKAGHTGTLDPLATGLLPICFGEATKFAGELLHADKSYRATLRLGVTTDTGDAEGTVLRVRPAAVGTDQLETVLGRFVGEIEQVPPMYSALKRDGRPLYEYARQGIELERQPRRVTIRRLALVSFSDDVAVIDVDCSKGTYVRTLAEDVGEALGCGAHLAALRRTRIGALDLGSALPLDELAGPDGPRRDQRLLPVDVLLGNLPLVELTAEQAMQMLQGRPVLPPGNRQDPRVRLCRRQGDFIGVGEIAADGRLWPRRMVAPTP